jgi:predicted DNA binding CopG/RHH family protein
MEIRIMKTKAKSIPEFKSVDEELEFWDKHSAVDFLDEKDVVEIDASKAREARDKRSTQQISLRFSHQILERTKSRAKTLGVPYQTLIQLWIAERLENEEALVRSLAAQTLGRKPGRSRQDKGQPADAK